MPSSTIARQMLSMVVPSLMEARKEGESGRRRITQLTRYVTVGLALFQSFGAAVALSNGGLTNAKGLFDWLVPATTTMTTGTSARGLDEEIRRNGPNPVSQLLQRLRRRGRLVLMGSMTVDLPLPYTAVMLNNWEILGQFMYPASAYRRLLDLLRCGLLDISAIRPRVFPLADFIA